MILPSCYGAWLCPVIQLPTPSGALQQFFTYLTKKTYQLKRYILLLEVDILGMRKKAILSIYGALSILGLLSATFGVLVLVLPITKGEAIVVVDFPKPSDSAQMPLTENDKQAVFQALEQITDQSFFKQTVTTSGVDSVGKVLGDVQGHVAGAWTEKIKVQADVDSSIMRVSVRGGSQMEKVEVAGVLAQFVAKGAPDFIGEGVIITRAKTPYLTYTLPGWAIADLIVGGLFFFFAGAYGFASQKNEVVVYGDNCLVAEKIGIKSEENKDPRYWLQKFLDENRN